MHDSGRTLLCTLQYNIVFLKENMWGSCGRWGLVVASCCECGLWYAPAGVPVYNLKVWNLSIKWHHCWAHYWQVAAHSRLITSNSGNPKRTHRGVAVLSSLGVEVQVLLSSHGCRCLLRSSLTPVAAMRAPTPEVTCISVCSVLSMSVSRNF